MGVSHLVSVSALINVHAETVRDDLPLQWSTCAPAYREPHTASIGIKGQAAKSSAVRQAEQELGCKKLKNHISGAAHFVCADFRFSCSLLDLVAVPWQALQDDPLTRYLACNSDDERARGVVTEYAQEILTSASSAGLLFHVNDFAAAALAHRIPEELVSTHRWYARKHRWYARKHTKLRTAIQPITRQQGRLCCSSEPSETCIHTQPYLQKSFTVHICPGYPARPAKCRRPAK